MQGTTTLSPKGQIVIPSIIRNSLKLKPSDVLQVSLRGNDLVVNKTASMDEFYRMFKPKKTITKKGIKNTYKKQVFLKHNIT